MFASETASAIGCFEPGDFVKVEFADERTGESEWMWVVVDSFDEPNRLIFGRLENHPVVFARELELGQELAVSFDKVREHRKVSCIS
jgi:hypothetical protein